MPNLSQIKLPNGNIYQIKDKAGRKMVAADYATSVSYKVGNYVIYNDQLYKISEKIESSQNTGWEKIKASVVDIGAEINLIKGTMTGAMSYLGVTTTPLTDGATTNPITIDGQSVSAEAGNVVIYDKKEFIFSSTGAKWNEFGDMGSLKALAFKDEASGSVTAAGNVTATFAGSSVTGKTSFTPVGTIGSQTVSVKPSTVSINQVTKTNTPSDFQMNVIENETLEFKFTQGKAATIEAKAVMTGATATVDVPKFTGTAGDVSISIKPEGTIDASFEGTPVTVTVK